MPQELVPFDFESNQVRVHIDNAGDPWWVASDTCNVLGIKNYRDAISRLESDEYRDDVGFTDTIGRQQKMLLINEKGLYRLIFRSNKPEAKRFQNWVFGEVLPSIRKTGRYEPSLPAVSDPTLQAILHQSKQIEALVISIDQARKLAVAAEERAVSAERAAMQVMRAQQYMTIRQYVKVHGLTRQLTPGTEQQQYGRWLTGYCREQGWPIYKQQSEAYPEWTYPVVEIQRTLYSWLARRHGQGPIKGLEVDQDGVWYDD